MKILALLDGDAAPSSLVFCLFHSGPNSEHSSPLSSVRGKFMPLQTDNDHKYQVHFLICALEQQVSRDEMCHVYVSTQPELGPNSHYVTLPLLPIEVNIRSKDFKYQQPRKVPNYL